MLKRVAALVGGLALLGGFFAIHARDGQQAELAAAGDGAAAARSAGATPSVRTPIKTTDTRDRDTGELGSALLRAALVAGKPSDPPDPFAEAIARQQLLDQRLAAAPPNPELTAQLGQALDGALPSDVTHTLTCRGVLCRVDLSGAGAVNQAIETFVDQLPKQFAATTILATSDTQRVIFASTEPGQLRVAPASTSRVVSQAPGSPSSIPP